MYVPMGHMVGPFHGMSHCPMPILMRFIWDVPLVVTCHMVSGVLFAQNICWAAPYRPTALPPYRPTALPPYCPTALPPYRPTTLLPYRPTALSLYWHLTKR